MSSIDFTNPQVLQNFINSQINEANGQIIIKDNVRIFVSNTGLSWLMPDQDLAKTEPAEEITEETPVVEEAIEEPVEEIVEPIIEEPIAGVKKSKKSKK